MLIIIYEYSLSKAKQNMAFRHEQVLTPIAVLMYLPGHFLRVSAITLELYSYHQWSSESSLIIESLVLCNCSGVAGLWRCQSRSPHSALRDLTCKQPVRPV